MRLGRLARTAWLTGAALCAATSAGCRTAPFVATHVDNVNAEYRQLEDYVYCLEDENNRLQRELDDCKAGRPAGRGSTPARPSEPGLFRRNLRDTTPSEPSELSPPMIDPGEPSEPTAPSDTPPRRSTSNRPESDADADMDLAPPTVELPAPLDSPAPPASPATPASPESLPPAAPTDTKITHIFLNPILTGGASLDSSPGDDGLSVVVEPRNAADEYVPRAGAVSIVVLDPSKAGEEARVARWNFDLAAAEQKLKTSSAARGIRLQMPWPAGPPASERLHLFVRYETADGRLIQSDREIFLTPPGQLSQRWTPRPADRQRPALEPVRAATEPQHIARQPQAAPASPSAAAPNLLAPPTWSPYR